MAGSVVVDTSVLIKWIKTRGEELVEEAHSLLGVIGREGLNVAVPALLLYEVGNVLLRTGLGAIALATAIDQLLGLPFTVYDPEPRLLQRAARLAHEYGLTFYDASFLALAEEIDCVFVTADRRLFNAARGLPRVRHLSAPGSVA